MSLFRCNWCGNAVDSDYIECHVDPKDDLELVCDPCVVDQVDQFVASYNKIRRSESLDYRDQEECMRDVVRQARAKLPKEFYQQFIEELK